MEIKRRNKIRNGGKWGFGGVRMTISDLDVKFIGRIIIVSIQRVIYFQ